PCFAPPRRRCSPRSAASLDQVWPRTPEYPRTGRPSCPLYLAPILIAIRSVTGGVYPPDLRHLPRRICSMQLIDGTDTPRDAGEPAGAERRRRSREQLGLQGQPRATRRSRTGDLLIAHLSRRTLAEGG